MSAQRTRAAPRDVARRAPDAAPQASTPPPHLTAAGLTRLQRLGGNAAVTRLLRTTAGAEATIDAAGAHRYNLRREYPAEIVELIEQAIGARVDGVLTPDDATRAAEWQAANGLAVDGKIGPRTIAAMGLEGGGAPAGQPGPDQAPADGEDRGAAPAEEAPAAEGPVEEAPAADEPVVEEAPAVAALPEDEAATPTEGETAGSEELAGTEALDEAARTSLEGVGLDSGHLERSDALVAAAREYTALYPELVGRYVAQPEPDATEKVRVLGEAAAGIARMEMLLGTIRHEGATWERVIRRKYKAKDGTTKTKRIKNTNRGDFVDHFSGGKASKPDETVGPWCTRFATSAYKALTGARGLKAGSGYKVANPDDFSGITLDYSSEEGGAFAGATAGKRAASATEGASNYNPWQRLRGELRDLPAESREEHARTFLSEVLTPQAGDTVVIARDGATTGSFEDYLSHTLMVERMEGVTMSLVEGNIAGRATGRTFDLSDPDDVGRIILVARPSLGAYGGGAAPAEQAAGEPVSAAGLMAPIAHVNGELLEVAKAGGWVRPESTAASTVAEIVTWGPGGTET